MALLYGRAGRLTAPKRRFLARADVAFAVGGIGMICTASYEARKYGVRSAMPGFIAVELCKKQGVDLKFVPTHFDRYKAASEEVR